MNKGWRRRFSLSELTIDIRWDDRFSENELAFLLSIVPFRDTQLVNRLADIDLQCQFAPVPFKGSGGNFKHIECYGLSIQNGSGQSIITDGTSTFAIDHKAGIGRLAFHSSFRDKSPLAKSNFFLVGLVHLFAPCGYFDLHGAGLINGGNGCLFLGPSGSGKSSLALNLVKKGWRYASDDALLIDSTKMDVCVLSFRKQFYVDPALAGRFPELDHEINHHGQNESEKYFVDLGKVWPNQFQPRFVPKKTLFCHVSGERFSRIKPISKKDALLRLLPQSASIFFNQPFAQQQVAVLKRLIEQTECYQLEAGLDGYDDPKTTADMIDSIHPQMTNLPDIGVARKILSSKYQPYVSGKIFRAP